MSIVVEMGSAGTDWGKIIEVGAAVAQAVFSVAAIIAAAWITNHDRAAAAKEQNLAKATALAALMELALENAHYIKAVTELPIADGLARHRDGSVDEAWRQLRRACRALHKVDVAGLEDPRLIGALFNFQDAMVLIRERAKRIRTIFIQAATGHHTGQIPHGFENWLADAEAARNTALQVSRGH